MSYRFKKIHLGYEKKLDLSVRKCHLKKSETEQYGFNLKSKNEHECHCIGKVDENTPADKSGLKAGNRIISINDLNIDNFTYEEIIELIKKGLPRNGKYLKNELVLTVTEKDNDELNNDV
jgi:C-terminal processing protease CtpA/Prc